MQMDKQKAIVLREFETLGYDSRADKQVSRTDFEEVRNFVLSRPVEGQSVLKLEHQGLKARNFVGIIQTRRGTTIEILPKIDLAGADSIEDEKKVFLKMLQVWRDGPCRNMGDADIRTTKNFPLLEVFIRMFLADLLELTRRGLARSYSRVENNLRVLKGKLVFSRNITHNLIHRERLACLSLVEQNPEGRREFRMRPDIVARKRDKTRTLVMDTKWKRLNENSPHHGISQGDLYQLYAYGKKYGKKYAASQTPVTLCLLYPRNKNFREKLSFHYENNLCLHVYPVRLDSESQFKDAQFHKCKTWVGEQE